MSISLFRKLTNNSLSTLQLNGLVADLGGSKNSSYIKNFLGNYQIQVLNYDQTANPDIIIDLEMTPLPLKGGTYDGVLLINVLEHIYNYANVIKESYRILKVGGEIVVLVPFLYYIHPSPHDFFRYSKEAIFKILIDGGFKETEVREVGCGLFVSLYTLLYPSIPPIFQLPLEKIAIFADSFLVWLANKLGKHYSAERYPLGYLAIAKK